MAHNGLSLNVRLAVSSTGMSDAASTGIDPQPKIAVVKINNPITNLRIILVPAPSVLEKFAMDFADTNPNIRVQTQLGATFHKRTDDPIAFPRDA